MSNDWNILPYLKVGLVSLLSVMLLVIDNPMHMVNKTMQSLLEANLKFNPKGQHLYSLWYGSGFRVATANAQNISVNRFGKGTTEMVSFEVISKERRILKYLCNYWWRWSYSQAYGPYICICGDGLFSFLFLFSFPTRCFNGNYLLSKIKHSWSWNSPVIFNFLRGNVYLDGRKKILTEATL